MQHKCVALILFLLLLAPATSAAIIQGSVSSVEFTDGAAGHGPFRGAAVNGGQCGSVHVEGRVASGTMVVEEAYSELTVGGVTVAPTNQTNRTEELTQTSVSLTPRTGCSLHVVALNGDARISRGLRGLEPAGTVKEAHSPHASTTRPDQVLDASQSIHAAGAMTVVLQGQFRIAAWETEIRVTNGTDEYVVDTGNQEEEVLALGVPARRGYEREAFIDLHDATLNISGLSSIYLDDIGFSIRTGRTILEEPRLEVDDAFFAGRRAELVSPATAMARPHEGGIVLEVERAAGLSVDGQAVRVADSPSWALWPALAAAAIAIVLLGIESRRRAARSETLVGRGEYRRAARMAATVSWLPLIGRPARIAQAVSLLRMDAFDQARDILTPARPWRSMQATWHYLWAHLSAATGDPQGARDSLAECLAMSPGYLPEAKSNPILEPVFEEAWEAVRRARTGHPEGYS